LISAVYFFVYFHRVSTSVIAADLLETFKTHAAALGLMSSMYFYLYAVLQPLVGYLSDRLGPRRVVGYFSLISAAGCVLFGAAPTIAWAGVGRGIIGIGVGGVYIPALKAFSQWFKRNEFATATGLLLAVGNIGAIVATTPLAWMSGTWGWRWSFFIIGAVTLGLALSTFFFLRDRPDPPPQGTAILDDKPSKNLLKTMARVVLATKFWIFAVLAAGVFGVFFTFQGLWATPFVMAILDMTPLEASKLNLFAPLGYIIGSPLIGRFVDRIAKRKLNVIRSLLAANVVIWVIITFGSGYLTSWGIIVLFLLMGVTTGGLSTSIWALLRDITPDSAFGSYMGLLNPFPLLGIAVLQASTGAIIARLGGTDAIYQSAVYTDAFILCLIVLIVCLSLLFLAGKSLEKK